MNTYTPQETFAEILAERQIVGLAAAAMEQDSVPAQNLTSQYDSLSEIITAFYESSPETALAVREYEMARVAAAAGVLSVIGTEKNAGMSRETADYFDQTRQFIGRSVLIVSEVDKLLAEKAVLQEQQAVSEQPAVAEETVTPEEQPARAETHKLRSLTAEIDSDGKLIINGKETDMLPAQRFVFEKLIDSKGPIQIKSIYDDPKFEEIIRRYGQTSPLSVAYSNAYNGLLNKLSKLGVEDFTTQVGSGRYSKVLELQYDVTFNDQGLMAKTEAFANHLFDELDIDSPVDSAKAAAKYFSVPTVGRRFDTFLASVRKGLEQELNGDGVVVKDLEGGLITLVETRQDPPQTPEGVTGETVIDMAVAESSESNTDKEQPKGRFLGLEADKVVFENTVIELTEAQQVILSLIIPDHQRGVTSKHLQQQLKERGLSTKDFESQFLRLRRLMGPTIVRFQQSGTARFRMSRRS